MIRVSSLELRSFICFNVVIIWYDFPCSASRRIYFNKPFKLIAFFFLANCQDYKRRWIRKMKKRKKRYTVLRSLDFCGELETRSQSLSNQNLLKFHFFFVFLRLMMAIIYNFYSFLWKGMRYNRTECCHHSKTIFLLWEKQLQQHQYYHPIHLRLIVFCSFFSCLPFSFTL